MTNKPIGKIGLRRTARGAQAQTQLNRTQVPFSQDATVVDLFEKQVRQHASTPALVVDGEPVSYDALYKMACAVAGEIQAQLPDGAGERVSILLPLSAWVPATMLGAMLAGMSYVPIDPSNPAGRVATLLEESQSQVLVTTLDHMPMVQQFKGQLIVVELIPETVEAPPRQNARTPSSIAYTIFTSGTTSRPKGVTIPDQALINYVEWLHRNFEIGAGDSSVLLASYAFDLGYTSLWGCLLNGATLHLVSDKLRLDPQKLIDYTVGEKLSFLKLTPSYFETIMQSEAAAKFRDADALRYVFLGGEAIRVSRIQSFHDLQPRTQFVNHYGPTECTIGAVAHRIPMDKLEAYAARPTIGQPIDNLEAYVLTGTGDMAAMGATGELCLAGKGLATGYLNRPEETASRFRPASWAPEKILYHTGDRVRLLPGGQLEFLGRMDAQLKLRGYRVEPGEVTAVLCRQAGVEAAIALPFSAKEGAAPDRLAAWVVLGEGASLTTLQEAIAHELPAYMVPGHWVEMEALPLSPNGKVDQSSLPRPQIERQGNAAPMSALEIEIATFWEGLLAIPEVGPDDNFFSLGGHSLKAIQLLSRLHEDLGLTVELDTIFDYPTLREFVAQLEGKVASADKQSPILSAPLADDYPLSAGQQRLWMLAQATGGALAYQSPQIIPIREAVDLVAFEKAVNALVARHEAFRTRFVTVQGMPRMQIQPPRAVPFVFRDFREAAEEASRFMQEFISEPFDLAEGHLLRAALVQTEEEAYSLVLLTHHIVFDGWSGSVIRRELQEIYAAFRAGLGNPLPDSVLQFKDYVVWQQAQEDTAAANYWGELLSDLPEIPALPQDFQNPMVRSFVGGQLGASLDRQTMQALQNMAKELKTTLSNLTLAVFSLLIGRLSGQENFALGLATANRQRKALENVVGFFVNTLPLHIDLKNASQLDELIARITATTRAAFRYQDYSFDAGSSQNGSAGSKLQTRFNVVYSFQNFMDLNLGEAQAKASQKGSATGEGIGVRTAKFDLSVYLVAHADGLRINLEYDAELFRPETAEKILETYTAFLGLLAELGPKMSPAEFHLGLGAGYAQEIEEIRTRSMQSAALPFPGTNVVEVFQKNVRQNPEKLAYLGETASMTYRELDERSDAMAAWLIAQKVKKGDFVGLYLDRSPEAVEAILGILKAGAAYLPVGIDFPQDRIVQMLRKANVSLLLVGQNWEEAAENLRRELPDLQEILVLDSEAGRAKLKGGMRPEFPTLGREDVAYALFTSGTTGTPKGVEIPHRGILRLVADPANQVAEGSQVGFMAPLTFDVSTWEIWMALLRGGTLHHVTRTTQLSPDLMEARIRSSGIDSILAVTPLFHLYAATRPELFATMAFVIVGGDVLSPKLAGKIKAKYPLLRLSNGYGPTENSVFSTAHEVVAPGDGPLPIGMPIDGTGVYVRDRNGHLLPYGIAGELCVTGSGVGLGYLGDPEITAEKFIPGPDGGLMYRTGDLARWERDGVMFHGRLDRQVKVSGFRIELQEVELRISGVPGVDQAHVGLVGEGATEKALAAWYVAGPELSAEVLRARLQEELPAYMIPAYLVQMDALPLKFNGKIDTKALPPPGVRTGTVAEVRPPANAGEALLLEIWQAVLGVDKVGMHEDFFALGGNSIRALKVIAQVAEATGSQIGITDFFARPRIAALAELLEKGEGTDAGMLFPIGPQLPQRKSILLLPPVAGNGVVFQALAQELGQSWNCYSAMYPGLQFGTELQTDLPGIARLLAEELDRQGLAAPAVLLGHSMGGLVGFEMAKILAPEAMIFLDIAPNFADWQTATSAQMQAPPARQRPARQLQAFAAEMSEEARARFAGALQHHRKVIQAYQPQGQIAASVFALQAQGNPVQMPVENWHSFTTADCHTDLCPGDHDGLLEPPHVQVVAQKIQQTLKRIL